MQAMNLLLLPRSSLASSDHGNDFLKHEHLSPLGTQLRFTSSFHAETTKQLLGSTGPVCVTGLEPKAFSEGSFSSHKLSHLSSRDTTSAPRAARPAQLQGAAHGFPKNK